jgi:hypothetical protein
MEMRWSDVKSMPNSVAFSGADTGALQPTDLSDEKKKRGRLNK